LWVNAVITNVAAGYEAHVAVVPLHIAAVIVALSLLLLFVECNVAAVFGNSSIVVLVNNVAAVNIANVAVVTAYSKVFTIVVSYVTFVLA